ncbi:MAG: hypothetical protein HKN42_18195 [Granulosicoccus sp.]|nr:hypothetical protein [Granulosicoccus sp.]
MSVSRNTSVIVLTTLVSFSACISTSHAQQTKPDHSESNAAGDDVVPMAEWLEFRKARYVTRPILLHLLNGHERAVLMPEPIRLLDEEQSLPGCAVAIDHDVIGFFPTRTFPRKPIKFLGLDSGTVYELRVRASPDGMQQPLQITR